MKNQFAFPNNWIFFIAFTIAITGCTTTTKPNTPAQFNMPVLDNLAEKNPLLVEELKKLPEIKEGISSSDRAALTNLAEIYNQAPEVFDKAFEQMYQVGIPEVRKYCSPLQAVYWLALDDELNIT